MPQCVEPRFLDPAEHAPRFLDAEAVAALKLRNCRHGYPFPRRPPGESEALRGAFTRGRYAGPVADSARRTRRTRAARCGSHQFQLPSRRMIAGASSARITVA